MIESLFTRTCAVSADVTPNSIKLGSRAVAWNAEEIDTWIQEKVDQSKSFD